MSWKWSRSKRPWPNYRYLSAGRKEVHENPDRIVPAGIQTVHISNESQKRYRRNQSAWFRRYALQSRDSVSIATCYGLNDCDSIRDGGKRSLSLFHSVQTGSGAHPTSYTVRTRGSVPRGIVAGGAKLTIHLHLVPRSRIVELYLHYPTCLHGVVLNQLSAGTTLAFINM
jgi:hypothetical protein